MSTARTIYKMQVKEVIDHTPSIRELHLETTEPAQFQFKAGQFVTLHVPQEPKPALRAYSIASSDQKTNGLSLIFKFVPNGVASTYVWSLKGGETLNFTGPFGRVLFKEPPTQQILFLSTGSGLSQHFCYLVSKKNQYPDLRYRLLLGVRNEQEIYYQQELENLKKEFSDFQYEFVLSRPSENWKGKTGYVQHHIKDYDYLKVDTTFYLCGNGGMIKEIKDQLIEKDQFDKTRIHVEAFD